MCIIRRHFRWVRDDSGGNVFSRNMVARPVGPSSQGETIFFAKYWWPVRWVPAVRWRNHYFPRNREALPCCCRGPSCQPLHVQSTSDGSRSFHVDHTALRAPGRWTMARPRKGTTRSWRRQGSGCTCGEVYEGSLVRPCCRCRRITGAVGEWRDGLASGGSSRER